MIKIYPLKKVEMWLSLERMWLALSPQWEKKSRSKLFVVVKRYYFQRCQRNPLEDIFCNLFWIIPKYGVNITLMLVIRQDTKIIWGKINEKKVKLTLFLKICCKTKRMLGAHKHSKFELVILQWGMF